MKKTETERIIRENEERNNRSEAGYNPYTGEGSPLERVRLPLDKNEYLLIPKQMASLDCIRKILEKGGGTGMLSRRR